jgi:RimJ/RimL family protein N-acetyltransferase
MNETLRIVRNFKTCPTNCIPIPNLAGLLRPVQTTLADATAMAKWRNIAFRAFLTWIQPTKDDMLNWLTQYQDKSDDIIFIIEMDTGKLAGQIALYNIDTSIHQAEFGRIIREKRISCKGIMTEACKAMFNWAFNFLHLETIFLEVFADNQRAISLYERLGFHIAESDFVQKLKNDRGIISWSKVGANIPLNSSSYADCRLLYTMLLTKSRFSTLVSSEKDLK